MNYFIETKSNTYYIDSLLDTAKWDSPIGSSAIVSYSFSESGAMYADDIIEANTLQALDSATREMTRKAFEYWSNVANITFFERSSAVEGDIRIAQSPYLLQEGAAGWAYPPSNGTFFPGDDFVTPNDIAGDVWLMPFESEVVEGDDDYYTIIHEIGHAIGLKHSFEEPDVLPTSEESAQYTVMSYTAHPNGAFAQLGTVTEVLQPKTPMLYDIAAIQYLYGANTSYNSGDNTYFYDDTPQIMTLWDGGGNDTLDFSQLSSGVTINLGEGTFSSFGNALNNFSQETELSDNFAIAFNTEIENVNGSNHADTLKGNSLDNIFNGLGGFDNIDGVSGDDVVIIDDSFDEITISSQFSFDSVTTTNGTLVLRNIDALQIDGGYVDLDDIKEQQIRVADTDNIMEIARLYQAALDREPDNDGLNYWIDEYERGFTLQDISQSFVDANEFTTRFDVSDDTGFITTLYANVLNRDPDEEGLNYWLGDITNGQSYSDILVSFSESLENKNNTETLGNDLDYQIYTGLWVI